MSADDYLFVGRMSNGRFGIVHRFSSSENDPRDFIDNAHVSYETLEEAVIRAHQGDDTEYGVRVDPEALANWISAHAA